MGFYMRLNVRFFSGGYKWGLEIDDETLEKNLTKKDIVQLLIKNRHSVWEVYGGYFKELQGTFREKNGDLFFCSDDRCSLGRVFKVKHLEGVLASC